MHLGQHPAPGLGELLPGFFVIPENPIRRAEEGVSYVPHVGELMPGKFVIPENPLLRAMAGCNRGCAGLESGPVVGLFPSVDWTMTSGMGAISDYIPNLSTNTWMLIGGGALIALLLLSRGGRGSAYRSEIREARYRATQKLQKDVAEIRAKYPRVGGRIARAARAF